jgi:hypothetical protein
VLLLPVYEFEHTKNDKVRQETKIKPRNVPLPPQILADAIQDKAHVESDKGRAAKSVKVEPKEQKTVQQTHPLVHGALNIVEEDL